MRTGEDMTASFASQPTATTRLACVGWVDFGNAHAVFLCLTGHGRSNKPMLPKAHAPSVCPASQFALVGSWHVWIADEHVSWRYAGSAP